MPLRLVELMASSAEIEEVRELLRSTAALQVWASGAADDALLRILVDAEHVESVSDALLDRFGSRQDFRLVVLAVEATVPAVEQPEESEGAAAGGGGSEKEAPQRLSREELYEDLADASRLTPVYMVMTALSTIVAAVGLLHGDVAIIIGAMVIAPLLGPNIALSLACTLGDGGLARRSLTAIAVGLLIAAGLSLLLGAVAGVDPRIPEIAARTDVGFTSIVVALAAGAAGSLAFTRGVPAVVVGVMVAVALLPPLVVAGLLAGAGQERLALGALILLVTNVTCVNLAAVATFLVQKVRPRTWWEAERAKRATVLAVASWLVMLLVLVGLMVLRRLGIV